MKYLKYFTFLDEATITALAEKVANEPHLRAAQKTLASEMTIFVHGQAALDQAIKISAALFSGDIKVLTADEIEVGFKDVPTFTAAKETALPIIDWLVDLKIEPSKRQAREDVTHGAIYINGERQQDTTKIIDATDRIGDRFTIVRKGKKKYHLVNYK